MRIEDTDTERSKQEYADAILDALAWMGISPDEPVEHQSARFDEHKRFVQQLLDDGKAYKDFYTQDEFFELYKQKFGSAEFAKAYRLSREQPQDQHKPYVVRFKLPLDHESVCFDDAVRGRVCFDIEQPDDFVIARSDGRPMYNFVVVLDDIHQGITQVIRGEDHISNTPKQLLLYEALGQQAPTFAHLPLILSKEGHRLSKRDAATSVMEYKDMGYLPDALFNYLVRLGWSHGDQELFSRDELITLFTLDHVGKKGAVFDQEKLDWLSGVYIREADNKHLLDYIEHNVAPELQKKSGFNVEQLLQLIGLYKERAKTLKEVADQISAFGATPTAYDDASVAKWVTPETAAHIQALIKKIESITDFNKETAEHEIKTYAKTTGQKMGMIAQPIRIALTGGSSSPSIFELLVILGKQASITRLQEFKGFLQART